MRTKKRGSATRLATTPSQKARTSQRPPLGQWGQPWGRPTHPQRLPWVLWFSGPIPGGPFPQSGGVSTTSSAGWWPRRGVQWPRGLGPWWPSLPTRPCTPSILPTTTLPQAQLDLLGHTLKLYSSTLHRPRNLLLQSSRFDHWHYLTLLTL